MMKGKIAFVGNSALTMMNFRKGVMSALVKDGYEVAMIVPQDCDLSPVAGTGIRVIPIEVDCKGTNPLHDMRFFRRLKTIYRQEHFDFIFHFTIKPVIYGSMAAAACGVKFISVVTGLGFTFIKRNWLFRLSCLLHRLALHRAQEVWFLNPDDCDCFVSLRLVAPEKVHVIHGEGVDTAFFAAEKSLPEKFSFIYIGRMLRYKGVELFVRAAQDLRKEYPDVRWKLLGPLDREDPSGILPEELEAWVKHGWVEYLGVSKDVRASIAQSTCVVLPSYFREGVPRSLLEAAAMQRPLITTNSVGCKEVVMDGINGLLCEKNNQESLEQAMRTLLKMPREQLLQMGQKGREMVLDKFDEKIIIGEYLHALEKHLRKQDIPNSK